MYAVGTTSFFSSKSKPTDEGHAFKNIANLCFVFSMKDMCFNVKHKINFWSATLYHTDL